VAEPVRLESISPKTILRKDTTAVKKTYHIVNREEKSAAAAIEQFARSNGQLLLPLIELTTKARIAVDEVIGAVGRKTIETVLMLSAEESPGLARPARPAETRSGTVLRVAG